MSAIEIKVTGNEIEIHDSEGLAGLIIINSVERWRGREAISLDISSAEDDVFVRPLTFKSVRLYL